jgi:hypothetical protein
VFCLQSFDGMNNEPDAGFHVQNTRTKKMSVSDMAGHTRQCAERVDGIDVPEQKNGLALGLTLKVDLHMVAKN